MYSQKLTGYVTPEEPMKIITDIRDTNTSFFRIYAWGPDKNTSDFNLWTNPGEDVTAGHAKFNSSKTGYPEVITVNSSSLFEVEPGNYSTVLYSVNGSGLGEVYIEYVYLENIDLGLLEDKGYSMYEIKIPSGLSRVVFITESTIGTDLDLFIQKGDKVPDSFEAFDYASISNCTDCWDTGIKYWVAEHFVIEHPEPGKYLMVTYAYGGKDFFTSYWMGVDSDAQNLSQEKNHTDSETIDKNAMKEKIRSKYSNIPFNIQFNPKNDTLLTPQRI